MQERKIMIINLLSGIIAILIAISMLYIFNTKCYECYTIDNQRVRADEIIEKANCIFVKQKDGTLVQIKTYKEIYKVSLFLCLFIAVCLYTFCYFIISKYLILKF